MTHILDNSIFHYRDDGYRQIYNLISDYTNDEAQNQAWNISYEIFDTFHESRHKDIARAIYFNLKHKSPNRRRHCQNLNDLGNKRDSDITDLLRHFNIDVSRCSSYQGYQLALYFQN